MTTTRGLFAALLLIASCRHEEEVKPVPVVRVRCVKPARQGLDETLVLRGHLEPPPGGDLPVASQVAGRVLELSVHEGDRVKTGALIATVDDLVAKDAARQAEASLAQATAAEVNANATLERTRTLVTRGIAARQELDDAVNKAEAEKQNVAAAHAALDLARHTLGRVQVRAAFGGTVTKIWRGPGAIVDGSAATPIVQMASASGAEFVADATERDLARAQAGQRVKLELATLGAPLEGTVRNVATALSASSGLGSVRVTLDASPSALIMGAHGRATLFTGHRDDALVLPVATLRGAVADGAEVVLCGAGVATVRAVGVGYRDQDRFEVVSGLSSEDNVALDHVLGLETGTRIAVAP